ncbi:hypothetical protein EVAR_67526_1 [Eumeta japonica]|uniref:Uncharacterized protein n=1 Tax=Eumeta variegata TaxID=151549 RepID=A0A4C1YX01_EUMVA|nr:hypothetical protein EVAR_67526_1 [Eumeta japonica]
MTAQMLSARDNSALHSVRTTCDLVRSTGLGATGDAFMRFRERSRVSRWAACRWKDCQELVLTHVLRERSSFRTDVIPLREDLKFFTSLKRNLPSINMRRGFTELIIPPILHVQRCIQDSLVGWLSPRERDGGPRARRVRRCESWSVHPTR